MAKKKIGKKVGDIKVQISYTIIDLFSAGLYSSPNKAFEELVSNSYDADAKRVSVFVAPDKTKNDATLWVCDNGIGMDVDGLKELWQIGTSKKREDEDKLQRLQIGKFGIGKLATYVLANKLTYICKSKKKYYMVIMDYDKIDNKKGITLEELELTESETKSIIEPYVQVGGINLLNFDLWGKKAEKSWTFCLMEDLKSKATEISEAKLRWILKTALPLNPNFQLFFNGSKIESSKIDQKPLKTWIVGKDDEKLVKKYKEYKKTTYKGEPALNLNELENVRGTIDMYRDSLASGKSEKIGRSHGIFLMVRGRLINVDDPLLGMDAFNHGAFNRTRIVIHADELDSEITSTRESVKDSPHLAFLREYIKRIFNSEVKPFWDDYQNDEVEKRRSTGKVTDSPASLSRRPLLAVARKFFAGEIEKLQYTEVPEGLSTKQQEELLQRLEDDLTSEEGVIKDVASWEILDPAAPLAKFDLATGVAKINLLHPFFVNFSDEVKSTTPFELFAVAEILTEAFLVEIGVSQEIIEQVMDKRDSLLRDFANSGRENTPAIATLLRDTLADSTGLEESVTKAFQTLGFDATKIGGNGKPDGQAFAHLGYDGNGQKGYSFVYDTKSTAKKKIKSQTAKISSSVRHRKDYKADYSLVVSIDFEGAADPESAISKESKEHKVTLITVQDLVRLLLVSVPKQLGLDELKDLFENCHTAIETKEWIDRLEARETKQWYMREILETIFKLQKEDTEPVELSGLRQKLMTDYDYLKNISKEEIKSLIESMQRLAPGFVSIHDGGFVGINNTPDKIIECINEVTTTYPAEYRGAFKKAFDKEE